PDDETASQLEHTEEPEGEQLAGDKLGARDRRDVELLERAELLLPGDVLRREQCADQRHEGNENAGHHVVAIVQGRIVPGAGAHVDARRARARRRFDTTRGEASRTGGSELLRITSENT